MKGSVVMGLARVITTIVKAVTGGFQMVELHEFREVPASEIKRLKVTTGSTNVELTPTSQENVILELKGQVSKKLEDAYQLNMSQSTDMLDVSISKRKSFVLFGFTIDRSKLNVRVPEKWFETLTVQTSSGDVEAEGLTANAINFRASSGELRVKRTETKAGLSLEASSGEIRVEQLKTPAAIAIQTSSGEIDAREMEASSINVRANSGDIDVRSVVASKVSIRTSSGEIKVRELEGNLTAEASSGDIEITNRDIKGEWNLSASSGDVTVKLDNPESVSVTFNGGSGDGKVKIKDMEYQLRTDHALVGKIGSGEHKLNVRTSSGSFRLS
jgi:lia operon protein LiaG